MRECIIIYVRPEIRADNPGGKLQGMTVWTVWKE